MKNVITTKRTPCLILMKVGTALELQYAPKLVRSIMYCLSYILEQKHVHIRLLLVL